MLACPCSDEDVEWLYPNTSLLDVARAWLQASPNTQLVVITRGADGLMSVTRGSDSEDKDLVVVEVPAAKIQVVDTVGAGDTVGAIVVEGIVKHGVGKLVEDPDCLTAVLARANSASAITCSRAGCHPPTLADLQ
jgi:fructokinase